MDLIQDGSTPTISQLTETSGDQWFTSGKLAMYPQVAGSTVTSFGKSPNAADYTVVPLPQDVRQATIGHALANVVAAKSGNPSAAKALQSFLAGTEAQEIQSKSGVLSAHSGTEDAFVSSYPGFNLQVFVDAISYAVPYPSSLNTAAWASAESDILAQVWGGTMSVADATKQLAAKMNEALAKE